MISQFLEGKPTYQKALYGTIMAVGVLLAILLFVSSLAIAKGAGLWGNGYPDRTISVSGYGEVTAVPDIAVFTFDVREEADTTEAAQKAAADKVNAIMEILADEDIDEKDIKTLNYSANPQYDWLPPQDCNREYCGNVQTLRNYIVSQSTQVKVRDTEKAGKLIGLVGEAGVDYVSGLSFTFDDDADFEEEALNLAIKDAKEKAKKRAELMDSRLGKIINFYESGRGGHYPEPYFEEYAFDMKAVAVQESAANPTISEGESTIIKTIEVVFEIK